MVAYNFKAEFAPPIVAGTKTQTIRRIAKRRHARPGERLQLYTGMRTRSCRKILASDPVCLTARSIAIDVGQTSFRSIVVEDAVALPPAAWEQFARDDGFESLAAMHRFFRSMHGEGVFHGCLIQWGQP